MRLTNYLERREIR